MPILARLALLLALAGCTAHHARKAPSPAPAAPTSTRAGPNPQATALAPAGATPSERLSWTIKIRGIELARLTMTSRPVAHYPKRAQIVSTVQTSGVGSWFRYVDRRTVTVSAGAVPVSAWAQKREQKSWRRVYTRFEAGSADVIIEQEAGSHRVVRGAGSAALVFNAETALHALRAWRPKSGEVVTGVGLAETRFWSMRFQAAGATRVEVHGRSFRARRIDGLLWRMTSAGTVESSRAPRAVTIWLSDDEVRRPLRFEADTKYGTIVCELEPEPEA